MTTNKAAEALLAAFSINERDPHDGTVIGHVLRDDPREKVAAVIAEATAAAEVARLREALEKALLHLDHEHPGWAAQTIRAALAPAVAPDPAPPAPGDEPDPTTLMEPAP